MLSRSRRLQQVSTSPANCLQTMCYGLISCDSMICAGRCKQAHTVS